MKSMVCFPCNSLIIEFDFRYVLCAALVACVYVSQSRLPMHILPVVNLHCVA